MEIGDKFPSFVDRFGNIKKEASGNIPSFDEMLKEIKSLKNFIIGVEYDNRRRNTKRATRSKKPTRKTRGY